MNRIRALLLASFMAGLALAAGLAFAGTRQSAAQEPGLQAAFQATMQGAVNAWNQGDVGAFISFWTDKGLQQEFEVTKAQAAELGEFIGDPPISFRSIQDVRSVSPTSGTAVIELAIGITVERATTTFILEGGRWRIDDRTLVAAPIPPGTTGVDVRLVEYGFVYDKAAVAGGNVAFRVQNGGREAHELALLKLDPGLPAFLEVLQASEEDEEPEGIEFIAAGGPWDPGVQTTMVLTQALTAGRYAMVCFIPAPDGVPHAFKGMVSEFTVGGAPGGGAIRPPSTGSGGLLGADSTTTSLGYALAGAMVLAGSAGLLVSRGSRIR